MYSKVDFKSKLVRRDKEGHFILIEGAIHQEEIIVNLHVSNVSAPNFIKYILVDLKKQMDPNTVIVRDFNTPPSLIGHPDKKINKETLELSDDLDQVDLIDACIVFHSVTAQHKFSLAAHELSPK
jgi:uncharacterized protein YueI